MLRSLYSGISGMKGFQTNLDVVSNNIANVNTSGYKKSRITFQDMMNQQIKASTDPTAQTGGTNASQVGLGSKVGSIDNVHTQGNRQNTDRTLDLALEGEGMFIVSANPTGNDDMNSADIGFTRAGNFYLDGDGRIVNSSGQFLLDVNGEAITVPEGATSISINGQGEVNYTAEGGEVAVAGTIGLAKFSNPDGLIKNGNSTYRNSPNAGLSAEQISAPGENGTAQIVSGALEMSNVDLSEEFTNMIIAQRGFQANTRIITTSDQILEELVNLKR
ncbi:flagellar basal body rod protein FlgG [Terribacillus sp. 7520-G]|uniref:flagellar basal body rod protein FlgG n=1 Tax=Terribacillus TaxID=459532 RepID=UPI000BA62391|nr:flagellar basal body rod protein FlgG [Terribacillus sp. 7520-G]PAD40068.1 flagellar basal body rod protein FlgG [Terribacillus sp. 7520-G]